jgi:uncharacterized protein (DUF2336 family)
MKIDLAGIDTLIYRSPLLIEGDLISIDGGNNIIPRILNKIDLAGIDTLIYRSPLLIEGDLISIDEENNMIPRT